MIFCVGERSCSHWLEWILLDYGKSGFKFAIRLDSCVNTIGDTILMQVKPWFSHEVGKDFRRRETVMESTITAWERASRFCFTVIACGVHTG